MSDFSVHNPPKEQTRLDNINVAKLSHVLYGKRHNKLRCDWMELCGSYAPTLRLLKQNNMIGESKFIGVDFDQNAIKSCQQEHPNHLFLQQRIETLLQGNDKRLSNVGVLNYDTENDWRTIYKHQKIITKFTEKQANRLGAFLLIVNGVCRQTNEKTARQYANEMMKSMGFSNIEAGISPYTGDGCRWKMLHIRGLIL